jgi:hypothetical protein
MHRGQILAEGTMVEIAQQLKLNKKTEMTGGGKVPDFSKYGLTSEPIEVEQFSEDWRAVLGQSEPGLLQKLVADGIEITSWAIRQPNVIEMLCAATGQSIEDVGLEVTSTAVIPLRTFRGEEE